MRRILLLLTICCCLSGCGFNARMWGDNFLRGWRMNIENNVEDNKKITEYITQHGMKDIAIIGLVIVVPIPVLLMALLMGLKSRRQYKKWLDVVIVSIEHGSDTKEIKKLCNIMTGRKFNKRVKKTLDKTIKRNSFLVLFLDLLKVLKSNPVAK